MADIFDDLTLTGAIRTPAVWIMTGEHPALGTVVTHQDDDDMILMRSTFPPECLLPAPTMAVGEDFTRAA